MILEVGIELFQKEVINSLAWNVYWYSRNISNSEDDVKIDFMTLDEEKSAIRLWLNTTNSMIVNQLNQNKELTMKVRDTLKKHYKYTGNFYFDEGLPF